MDRELAKRRSQHITALAERSASARSLVNTDGGTLKSPRAVGASWPWSPRRLVPVGPPMEKGMREGFLMKYPLHGHALSRPRRRFFRLTSHVIEWSVSRGKQIKGHMSLHEAELEQLSGALARSASHVPRCCRQVVMLLCTPPTRTHLTTLLPCPRPSSQSARSCSRGVASGS